MASGAYSGRGNFKPSSGKGQSSSYGYSKETVDSAVSKYGGTAFQTPSGWDWEKGGFSQGEERALLAGSGYSSGLESWLSGFPMLHLTPYTGRTSTQLTPGTLSLVKLAEDMANGNFGIYRDVLGGDVDNSLFNRAVVYPAQRDLLTSTIPAINQSFAGKVGQGSFFSGARQRAVTGAATGLADTLANARLQYRQQATQNSLNATGQLGGLTNISDYPRQVDAENLSRAIQVHFQNQGLAAQEYQGQVARANAALQVLTGQYGVDQNAAQIAQQAELRKAMEQAQRAQLVGTLVGAGLGAATGGLGLLGFAGGAGSAFLGASAGSQLGGGLGLGFGTGQWGAAAPQIVGGLGTLGTAYAFNPSLFGGDLGTTPVSLGSLVDGGYGAYPPTVQGAAGYAVDTSLFAYNPFGLPGAGGSPFMY